MKFVYFDIGGVLVKDFSATKKWSELITKLKISNEKRNELERKFDKFESEACVGRDVEDFLAILKNDFGIVMPKGYSILRDCVSRFERNNKIWEIVKECEKKHGVGLLTNMYPGMVNLIEKNNLIPKVKWKVVIDSSVVKCKKPEKKIYEIAQKEAGVKAEEILFVDNLVKNLKTAKDMAWKTFWFDSRDYEKSNEELGLFLANKVEF